MYLRPSYAIVDQHGQLQLRRGTGRTLTPSHAQAIDDTERKAKCANQIARRVLRAPSTVLVMVLRASLVLITAPPVAADHGIHGAGHAASSGEEVVSVSQDILTGFGSNGI